MKHKTRVVNEQKPPYGDYIVHCSCGYHVGYYRDRTNAAIQAIMHVQQSNGSK